MSNSGRTQVETDHSNIEYWNELCSTQTARLLGVTDNSPASLKKFDDWYFNYYPYLSMHIPFQKLEGKRVLEVGLGYGTLSQRLAEAGAHYHGLDISPGPVAMAQHRLKQAGVQGDVQQGSILDCPFGDDYFDCVVAIGCLHHTGNLAKAIEEVHRVLKPGCEARFMVYNATSYRQWYSNPGETMKRIQGEKLSNSHDSELASRWGYDFNSQGQTAPQTEFVTRSELHKLCSTFNACQITLENIGAEGPLRYFPRAMALWLFSAFLGLDLYCCAKK